jgi:hypothetical protein
MRLGVGLHSLGLAERSLQLARDYARERLQGRDATGAQRPIIEHADVRRMLLMMKALTQAARCLAYTAAATLDVAHCSPDASRRAVASRRADLLTPIVKAWCSEVAVEVASLGVQVHGGMGFINDAEISQVYRDSRIGPIFEGTNYIQAQDLLGRKVLRDHGAVLGELLAEIESAAHAPRTSDASAHAPADAAEPLAFLRAQLLDGCARLRDATADLLARSATEPDLVGATAYHFLHWVGTLAGGWQLALLAERARSELSATDARALADLAAFYGAHFMPRMLVHEAAVRHGVETISKVAPADI